MNERAIQNALYPWLAFERGYLLSCPNYTPAHWFECDLFAVTKANFAVEFEVKISRADFKADAKKGPDEYTRQRFGTMHPENRAKYDVDLRSKHERLTDGDTRGPSRFFYVTPAGLIQLAEVPSFAGLIELNHRNRPKVIKEAPKLHRTKVDDKVLANCRAVFYHRFWTLRRGLKEEAATVPE